MGEVLPSVMEVSRKRGGGGRSIFDFNIGKRERKKENISLLLFFHLNSEGSGSSE